MKNAMKINKKEVLFGAVSGVIVAVAGTIFSHILTKNKSHDGIELMKNEAEIEEDDNTEVNSDGVLSGADMLVAVDDSEKN